MKQSVFAVMVFFIVATANAWAEDLTIAAAANLQFALEELTTAFTKETGVAVKTVLGSSGKLTSQIENGAPFDIFMSADMDYPNRLLADGLTTGQPKIYAYGSLVLWTFYDIDISKGMAGLTDQHIRKIAIASPKAAPYGRQAVNAMTGHHLYPGIAAKLVYGESIAQVNQFITTRAADIGFTAKSIVVAANMKGKGKWAEVNAADYDPIAQGVVILKRTRVLDAAQQFEDFLFSDSAKIIFKNNGYHDTP